MKRNGFTLVELLAVIVILGITFMFVLPSITSLFEIGRKTETELIEERILSAAKEYVNNVDGSFYKKFYKEGDINYIYKSDLITAGLVSEEDILKLDTFAGVKGELLSNDRIRYTVQYINVPANNYTNEELYNMIQDVSNSNSLGSSVIENVKDMVNNNSNAISELTNTASDNNIFLKMYPVGSIYVNSTNTNPSTMLGGTWELIDKRFKGLSDRYISEPNSSTIVFTPTDNISSHSVAVVRAGNTIRIRLDFVNSVELTESSVDLGTFNYTALGITSFLYNYAALPCATDNGNGIAYVTINDSTGIATVIDVISKNEENVISASKTIYCNLTYTFNGSNILDSAAGEFHFKRIA